MKLRDFTPIEPSHLPVSTAVRAGVWFSCYLPPPLSLSPLLSSLLFGDRLGATDASVSCRAAVMLIGPDGESFVAVCSPEAAACRRKVSCLSSSLGTRLLQGLAARVFMSPVCAAV